MSTKWGCCEIPHRVPNVGLAHSKCSTKVTFFPPFSSTQKQTQNPSGVWLILCWHPRGSHAEWAGVHYCFAPTSLNLSESQLVCSPKNQMSMLSKAPAWKHKIRVIHGSQSLFGAFFYSFIFFIQQIIMECLLLVRPWGHDREHDKVLTFKEIIF